MTFAEKYNLRSADAILVPLFRTQILKHYAVFFIAPDGSEWVVENVWLKGVQLISASDFFGAIRGPFLIDAFQGNDYQRAMAAQRADNLIGKAYGFLDYNCEHFVSEVRTGRAESAQVRKGATLLLVGCLLGIASKNS